MPKKALEPKLTNTNNTTKEITIPIITIVAKPIKESTKELVILAILLSIKRSIRTLIISTTLTTSIPKRKTTKKVIRYKKE